MPAVAAELGGGDDAEELKNGSSGFSDVFEL
jgi:hypothetical protein